MNTHTISLYRRFLCVTIDSTNHNTLLLIFLLVSSLVMVINEIEILMYIWEVKLIWFNIFYLFFNFFSSTVSFTRMSFCLVRMEPLCVVISLYFKTFNKIIVNYAKNSWFLIECPMINTSLILTFSTPTWILCLYTKIIFKRITWLFYIQNI